MPALGRLQPVSAAPGSDGLPRAELRLQACEEPQKRTPILSLPHPSPARAETAPGLSPAAETGELA